MADENSIRKKHEKQLWNHMAKWMMNLMEGGLIMRKKVNRSGTNSIINVPKELRGQYYRVILIPLDNEELDYIERGKKVRADSTTMELEKQRRKNRELKQRLDNMEQKLNSMTDDTSYENEGHSAPENNRTFKLDPNNPNA